MISFGFTIYKFLQAMFEAEKLAPPVMRPTGPRSFGLALFSLGVWRLPLRACSTGARCGDSIRDARPFSLALAVAGFVALFGILALMNMLFHIGPF